MSLPSTCQSCKLSQVVWLQDTLPYTTVAPVWPFSLTISITDLHGLWKSPVLLHSIKNCANLDASHILTVCIVCFLSLGPLGFTWIKHYCTYDKGSKTFTMSVSEVKSSGKMVSHFFFLLFFNWTCYLSNGNKNLLCLFF